jgi:hypothetical protein
MTPADLWAWLPFGYLVTILIETPVLVVGLSPRHSLARKLFAGAWLTACTYPIVVLVMPLLITSSRGAYLAVAETFAPVAECALFWLAFRSRETFWRDMLAIVVANLASFLAGVVMYGR